MLSQSKRGLWTVANVGRESTSAMGWNESATPSQNYLLITITEEVIRLRKINIQSWYVAAQTGECQMLISPVQPLQTENGRWMYKQRST